MKTLKRLSVIFILLIVVINNANSQPVRTEDYISVAFFVPCVNEWITGNIIAEKTFWTNMHDDSPNKYSKIQLKYENVELCGQTSHLTYTLDFISNSELAGEAATVRHFSRNVLIRLDGKLIAMLPLLIQRTRTPDGELVVSINDLGVRCF